jgi:hypothetical protein
MGVGRTFFKKLCRQKGIIMWPHHKPSGAGADEYDRGALSD